MGSLRIALNGRFYGVRPTGVQRFAREVAARLGSAGDVTLFVPREVTSERGTRKGEGGTVRGALPGQAWEQVELPWAARRAGCDVTLNLANSLPRWGGPHVVVVYDVTPLTHPQWYTRPFVGWWRMVLAPAIKRAARILTITDWARGEIEQTLGIPPERIGVVPQGVAPFDGPADPQVVTHTLERFGLAPGYVLAQGGEGPRKNLGFLLATLSGSWQLVVVGEPYRWIHGAGGRGKGEGDRDSVRWLGHVSDEELHALYTGAGMFCFPSLAEGFGRPPLEAMACGTPAIVADYGAAREVLGDAAMILPLEPALWRSSIARVLGDPAERRHWREAGRRRAGEFRWEPAVDGILEACREVGERGTGNGER